MVKEVQDVKVVVEGKNQVSLVFPKGTDLQVKKSVSVADLAKVLRAPKKKKGDVEGQEGVRTPAAIGGVRG
jgi:hypothetical protein